MPVANISSPLPQLPPEFLQQLNRAGDQQVQIMQHGADQRTGIMATMLQDALESRRQTKSINESNELRVKENDRIRLLKARDHAAQMGIKINPGSTAEELENQAYEKTHNLAVQAAKTTYDFYKGQLEDIQNAEKSLNERQFTVLRKGAPAEQQKDALIAVLNESTKIPSEIRETALNALMKAKHGEGMQAIVDKTLDQISKKGLLGGSVFSNVGEATDFLNSYTTKLQELGAPVKQAEMQAIFVDRQEQNRLKTGVMNRMEVNALPVWQAAGEEGAKFVKDIGKTFGGQAAALNLNSMLSDDLGAKAGKSGEDQIPPPHQPSAPPVSEEDSGAYSDPNRSFVSQIPDRAKELVNTVGEGIGSVFGGALSREVVPRVTGMFQTPQPAHGLPPTSAGVNAYKQRIGYKGGAGAGGAAATASLQKLSTHPLAAQAPDDKIIGGSQSMQTVKAYVDSHDPSGRNSQSMIEHLQSQNPDVRKLATQVFNSTFLLLQNGIDPQKIMSTNSAPMGSAPPVEEQTSILSGQFGKYPLLQR